jgi:hypothetical protein
MALTRYLYNKSSVILSLRNTIHEGSYELAAFWAYELYFSGFQKETIAILLDIYDKRFSQNHPKLGLYIKKKLEDVKDETIATIVKNLTIKRAQDNMAVPVVTAVPAKFVNVKAYHIEPFKTLDPNEIQYKWKYLQIACKYAVCKEKMNKSDADARLMLFRRDWLYACSLCPIWADWIKSAGGTIANESVIFDSEDDEESFYEQYGFEPDEQPLEIQMRCMGI